MFAEKCEIDYVTYVRILIKWNETFDIVSKVKP